MKKDGGGDNPCVGSQWRRSNVGDTTGASDGAMGGRNDIRLKIEREAIRVGVFIFGKIFKFRQNEFHGKNSVQNSNISDGINSVGKIPWEKRFFVVEVFWKSLGKRVCFQIGINAHFALTK